MQVRFPEVDAQYIKGKVQDGFYTSENEVVRDAVRRMREDEEKAARFHAAIQVGRDQVARGETSPLTKELMQALEREAIERAKRNEPIVNADVLPR